MQVTVNEHIRDITENTTLSQLCHILALPLSGIAISVNQEVIPKGKWKEHILVPNDQILIITASQGG